jgi:hypothetical protein
MRFGRFKRHTRTHRRSKKNIETLPKKENSFTLKSITKMKKKLQDLLDNYSSLLSYIETRHDQDMVKLYQIEVQLMNLIEIDLKKPTKRKSK